MRARRSWRSASTRPGWTPRRSCGERRIPLCSQESGLPLSSFDIVGFTLQYELSFATILAMLELGGIPVRAARPGDGDPLVVAGGPVAFAPEPLADFVDAFLIGDGEEAALELVRGRPRVEAATAAGARTCSGRSRGSQGCTCPSLHGPGRGGAEAHRAPSSIGWTTGGFPCRTWRSSTTAPARSDAGLRAGLPLLSGRVHLSAGARAGRAGDPGDGGAGACRDRATRRFRCPRCPSPICPVSATSSRPSWRVWRRTGRRSVCRPCGWRP